MDGVSKRATGYRCKSAWKTEGGFQAVAMKWSSVFWVKLNLLLPLLLLLLVFLVSV